MRPNGWKRVKLGDVAKVTSGGTPLRTQSEYWNGDIPWVKTAQIQNGHISKDQVDEYITDLGVKESSAKIVPKGTLLMAMYGQGKTRGQVAILDIDATINQACAAFHLKEDEVSTQYLFQYFLFNYENIRNLSNDGGQKNLSAEIIKKIPLDLPPIEEQKKIAATLSVWDSAIEKMEKLIEAKIVQKNSLTCKLIEKSSEAKFKLENVTIDKSKWERKRLGELLEFKNGVNVEKDKIGHGTKMISVLDILSDKPITYDNIRSSVALTTEELSIYSVHYGDVLFQRSSENYEDVGTSNVYIDEKCATFSGFVIRGKKIGAYNPFCLNAILRAPSARCQIMRKAAGAQHVNIGQESLANIQIFLPTLLEQKAIAEVLSAIDDELSLLKQQLENYKKQKQGLMQKLLTGEWRVK
jgi:type I restriction enzyme S subunit